MRGGCLGGTSGKAEGGTMEATRKKEGLGSKQRTFRTSARPFRGIF